MHASIALLLLLVPPAPRVEWPRPDERITCGPLVLEVYVSRTAHLFHVVDQLSAWDNACHGQYREHMPLSGADEAQLASFARVREKRRWGAGLEQTFYTPLSVADAIRAGVKERNVTQEEADVIRPVLEHFAPRVDALLAEKRDILRRAFTKIDRARLTKAAEELARFTGVKKLVVPTFPLASPAPGGGGMDGGRLKWELDSDRVPFSVLLHESTHGFVMQKNPLLQSVVERTPGLTLTLLGEGFAYAMAPGLYGDDDSDNLRYNVDKDRAEKKAWEDEGYGRQRMFALALRPLFKEALRDSTLEAFLPRTRDVFLALNEVYSTTGRPPGPPRLAIAGPAADVVRERLLDSRFHMWIHRFDHDAASYTEVLPKLGEGDLFVILLAGKESARIPAEHASLAPLDSAEIEKRLSRGESIAEERKAADGLRVVLLAATDLKTLEQLARTAALLNE